MSINNKVLSSWREQDITLNENAPTEVYFRDTEPNHIVFTNPTSNTMYIAESANVSQNYHEMQVPSGGTKMFAKAKAMKKVYIWHASNLLENIHVVSFYDVFNPQSIAQTQETVNTQNITGTVDVATLPALPGGTNHIGEVSVSVLPALTGGNNHIGEVAVNQLPSLPAGTNAIGSVTKYIGGALTDHSGTITTGGTAQQVTTVNANRKFLLLQNVSSTDLWVNFGVVAVAAQPSIKLASGEKLIFTEFIPTDSISIIGGTAGQAFTIKEA